MNPKRGFTILELIVAVTLGAFIAVISGLSLRNASKIFTNVSGRDAAVRNLIKARRILENELILVNLASNRCQIQPAPASLGGDPDGDAINFLSAVNTTTGDTQLLTDGSGSPYYFRNVFYYLSVPTNHDALFGVTCTGGSEGYDFNCPHKILLRGVQDQNPTFDPGDSSTQDTLLAPLAASLVRPTSFPKTTALDTVAANLLHFRVRRSGTAELIVELSAVSLVDAGSKVGVGNRSFRTGPYTIQHQFSIFPKN